MPLGTAIFFVLGLLLINLAIPALPARSGGRGVLGGPSSSPQEALVSGADGQANGLLLAQPGVEFSDYPAVDKSFIATQSMKEQGGLYGTPDLASYYSGFGSPVSYKIRKGDTLASIASSYGLTTQTLISSNPGLKKKSLRTGQEIKILPVSGVLHRVSAGETLSSVSQLYNVSKDAIREFNSGIDLENLNSGVSLVIPGASSLARESSDISQNQSGYFKMPADGLNWGVLHGNNAVDIANTCGTDIFASAEGLVVDTNSNGWNNGYGSYVVIEHPIGAKTRYAHLEKILVEVGDYVKQGEVIGKMGDTGDATGCHLHFEILGAKNNFAK